MTGGAHFLRRRGAAGDVAELQYVIALHQTCPTTRDNGTISSRDIQLLLKSRYGLTRSTKTKDEEDHSSHKKHSSLFVSHKDALELVRSFAGGTTLVQQASSSTRRHHHNQPHSNHDHNPTTTSSSDTKSSTTTMDVTSTTTTTKHWHFPHLKKKSSPSSSMSASQVPLDENDTPALTMDQSFRVEESIHSLEDAEKGQQQSRGLLLATTNGNNQDNENDDDDDDQEISGDGDDHPEEYLDLVQIMAMLLIPTMARVAEEHKNGHCPEPLVEEIVLDRWYKQPLKPLTYCIDQSRKRRAKRDYDNYQSLRPLPHYALPGKIKELWWSKLVKADPHHLDEKRLVQEPRVDEDTVRKLLIQFGEYGHADNPKLIREMVQAAQSTSGFLDEEAVVNALASDLGDWDIESDYRISSFFHDVFRTSDPWRVTKLEAGRKDRQKIDFDDPVAMSQLHKRQKKALTKQAKAKKERFRADHSCFGRFCLFISRILTLFGCCGYLTPATDDLFIVEPSNIDMVRDEHSSRLAMVLMWLFLLGTFAVYITLVFSLPTIPCSFNPFWCEILISIYSWGTAGIILSTLGVLFMIPLSVGNNPFRRSFRRLLFSTMFTVFFTLAPFLVVQDIARQQEAEIADATETAPRSLPHRNLERTFSIQFNELLSDPLYSTSRFATLIIGCILTLTVVIQIITRVLRISLSCAQEFFSAWKWLASTSNDRAELRLKWAATRKINLALMNAFELHTRESLIDESSLDPRLRLKAARLGDDQVAISNFVLKGEHWEKTGGIFWTWRRILNGTLFHTEGIWINSRLLWFQTTQIFSGMLFLLLLFRSVESIAQQCESARADLGPSVPEWYKEIIPTPEMIYIALYPAWGVAAFVSLLLIILYIPSSVSTQLKYRCQVHPSLGSPYFEKYRKSVDYTYMNAGNAVWGMLGAGLLFYFLIGLIIFLFLWPVTQDIMLSFLAWCIGIGVTVMLKMLLSMGFRKIQYRSFYRVHPNAASLTSLALECWYIVLGGSILISRIGQFLFAAAFWVGRTDVNFLSEDVCLLGYSFDYVPTNFVKDLLVHEAHRHPYIERLAQMYLMKLRFRDTFHTDAGAVWRHLMVLAMFPWLAKYRVFDSERLAEAKHALLLQQQQQAQQAKKRQEQSRPTIATAKKYFRSAKRVLDPTKRKR